MKFSKWFSKNSDAQSKQVIQGKTLHEKTRDDTDKKNRQAQDIQVASSRHGDQSMRNGMEKSRSGFISRMDSLLSFRKEIDAGLLDEIEEILVMADMGVSTVQEIFDRLRIDVKRRELKDPEILREYIRKYIRDMLVVPDAVSLDEKINSIPAPFVILVAGVNGVGKTTTIAKMAHIFSTQGKKTIIAAADTFRAAAIDQLEEWGRRLDVPVIRHQPGSDPSAVAFDAIESGMSRGTDIIIVDTAGRLHTQVNLMEELKKIKRVMGRKLPDAPHETLLVLDATTGQNAVNQARFFMEATPVTGIVLTKLDGTARGGIAAGIVHEMKVPIYFTGVGEKLDDLLPFDADEFVNALFD